MKVSKIGIYTDTTTNKVGNTEVRVVTGRYKDNKIEIYSEYENGKLKAKLYYVFDKLGNMLKDKLIEIKDGKRVNDNIDVLR